MTETYNEPPETTLFWECNQLKDDGKNCGHLNHKTDMKCRECKMKRDKGDIAFNKNKRVIGLLKKVENGVEHWEHYDLDV
jgi:hypothetical protein